MWGFGLGRWWVVCFGSGVAVRCRLRLFVFGLFCFCVLFWVCLAVADWLLVKLFRFCWLVYGCFYVTVLV